MKLCAKCKERKPTSEFSKGSKLGTLHSYCKTCNYENRKLWNVGNAEKNAAQRLYEKYRLRPEQLQQMLEDQDFQCLICEKAFTEDRKSYHIDHDHSHCPARKSCGLCIRGLLCPGCNTKIWWYEIHFKKLMEYLARPRPVTEISPRRRGKVA